MTLEELKLELQDRTQEVRISDEFVLLVRTYLPIDEKTEFIEFVALNAIDEATGTFSPLRVELYFALAMCKWYAGIDTEGMNPGVAYDLLESNKITAEIVKVIPKDEFMFILEITEETVKDMSRYNSSAAGIIQSLSAKTSDLDEQLNKVLELAKNAKGIENLTSITDILMDKPKVVVKKG